MLCGLMVIVGAVTPALADINPPGCSVNGMSMTLGRTPGIAHVGDTIQYTATLSNGPFPACNVSDVLVVFHSPGVTGAVDLGNPCVLTSSLDFDVGTSETFNSGTDACLAIVLNVNPGVTVATAQSQFTGTLHDSPGDEDTVDDTKKVSIQVVHPSISVTKVATPTISQVGFSVDYEICVTNNGDITLANITVVDSLLGDLSASFADSLVPGASECHTFPRTILPGDPDPLLNTVTATGTDVAPGVVGFQPKTVSDTDDAEVNIAHPSIEITKTADPTVSQVGDSVDYEICVTNTGDITLVNITVVDSLLGDISGFFSDSLLPGAMECNTFPRVVLAGDADPLVNTVTVHSNPEGFPNDITDTDDAEVNIVHPSIEITKTADPTLSLAGGSVDYEICVTNTGDITLENITVVDSLLGDLSASFANTLAPGVTECHTFPRTVQVGDPDPLVNTVTVHSNPVGFINDVTDTDDATVDLVHPSIDITKTPDVTVAVVGDTVNYEICVTNTGDITLENITVVDSLLGDLSASFANTLAPGVTECHTFPRTVVAGDPDPVINTVTVHSNPEGFPNDITDNAVATVDLVQPDIAITKTADATVSKVGDTVNYEICIENTGTSQLVNITVTDSLLGDLSGSFADTLAPTASECHTFPRDVQPGDPDPLVNVVTVHANPQGLGNDITDSTSATVDLVHPDILVTKTANPTISEVGGSVDYQVCVTNAGDVMLENITVVDSLLGDLSASFADSLAPGGNECHTFPRTVVAGDPDPVINTVTVHSNPVGLPNDITDTAMATVDLVQPDIEITKTADTTVSKVGDSVNYEICISNTGTSELVNITVTDSLLGDLSAFFDDSLLPGANECHTFALTVQAGDPDPLVNIATVHANPLGLPSDVTDSTSATVDLVHPDIEITKAADVSTSKAGDSVNYQICITNAGDVQLVDITVTDSLLGDLSASFANSLAPGAPECHTFTRTVDAGDPDPLVNTATVHSHPQGLLNDITASASDSVDLLHPAFTLEKICSPDPVAVGGTLTWTITLINTGDVSLDIHVTDAIAGIDEMVVLGAGDTEVINATHVVTAGDPDPIENTVTGEATATGGIVTGTVTHSASSSCPIAPQVGGATRTPGYWFTHPAALLAAYECITGSANGTITLCPATCAANANDAMAIFWKASGGRATLGVHILSAMFNQCELGTPAPGTIIQDGLDVLCDPGATSDEIGAAIGPLDAFNNSGDSQPLPAGLDFGAASPKNAKSMAKAGSVPGCVK
jgi:uncharacterized repeat protein (TIGR01451 family)